MVRTRRYFEIGLDRVHAVIELGVDEDPSAA
jgi:hypothetical protein